jgi:hypothetical protein
LSSDEYKAYREVEEQRQVRFSLLRETAVGIAAYSALTEEEAINLIEEIREEIAVEASDKR